MLVLAGQRRHGPIRTRFILAGALSLAYRCDNVLLGPGIFRCHGGCRDSGTGCFGSRGVDRAGPGPCRRGPQSWLWTGRIDNATVEHLGKRLIGARGTSDLVTAGICSGAIAHQAGHSVSPLPPHSVRVNPPPFVPAGDEISGSSRMLPSARPATGRGNSYDGPERRRPGSMGGRTRGLNLLSLAFWGIVMCAPSQAAGYPEKNVTVIAPFPAGGASDSVARLTGPKMTDNLGKPVIIDNRPGATSSLGAAAEAAGVQDARSHRFCAGIRRL